MSDTKEYIRGDKHVHEAGSVMIKFAQYNVPEHQGEWKRQEEKEAEELEREFADFEEMADGPQPNTAPNPKVKPMVQETFADRVKAIVRKAATKNGQRVESNPRGNTSAYIYHINAEAFCKAMDEMVSSYGHKLQEFLGGSMNCVQVTKVCFFIGHVIRMHVINDTNLQMADIVFAFEDYYDNAQTVKSKLGNKRTTSDQDVMLGAFEGLLKKHTA
ncbi:MAG: hypothetical protein IJ540_04025 [Prevotella sp.]|jgi:hypothetical protein|nr:hypothetical protein [Prevotella sp.]